MIGKTFALWTVLCAALACAAEAAPPPAKHAVKPASATAPAKPAAPATGRALNMQDPANLIALLTAGGIKAEVGKKDADTLLVSVTSPKLPSFSILYAGCDAQGRGCKAALFDMMAEGAPTLAQINDYNQASAMCRGYQDHAGKAHVTMPWLLFADATGPQAATTINAWTGCMVDFTRFAKDPIGFLANAS